MNAKRNTAINQPSDCLQPPVILSTLLKDDGTIPNNSRLPLLVYQNALNFGTGDAASVIEQILEVNQWGGSWRNGIYPYHHYHSTAHEVLVVYAGQATVQLGGEKGILQTIQQGDAIVLPAGVGHKRIAYPEGQDWDMCYGKPGERPEADRNIERVPLPKTDPLYGGAGPLMGQWKI
jgi:uncharacterized protein YjlB